MTPPQGLEQAPWCAVDQRLDATMVQPIRTDNSLAKEREHRIAQPNRNHQTVYSLTDKISFRIVNMRISCRKEDIPSNDTDATSDKPS
jgi:hypothetical protein